MKPIYKIDKNTMVDEFDVDHSKFSLRDEIEYNFKRAKERELAQYYANNLPMLQNIKVPQTSEYNIRDDKNYAWNKPEPYDRRNNAAGVLNNFIKINKENPVSKPISTGNIAGDNLLMQTLKRVYPPAHLIIQGINNSYQLGGYLANIQKAYSKNKK